MDVTFESFAELVYRLGHPPPSKLPPGPDGRCPPLSPTRIFASWIKHLPPLPPKTTARVFRLLFPHEGNRRRYGLREMRLAAELERLLAIEGLTRWDEVGWEGVGGLGCLGDVVAHAVLERVPETTRSTISITEVDALLDELAASSAYSQLSQVPIAPRPPAAILLRLYREAGMSPHAMAVLTQVILRDLRPLLSPLPPARVRHPTLLLRVPASRGPAQLGLHDAMWVWDPVMARLFRDGKGCMEWCAAAAEAFKAGGTVSPGPVLGVNVQIPKCVKGRSVRDALKGFLAKECGPVWAETKYDGYRMQIHVEVVDARPKITVFSKSKRKSTADRRHTHDLILAALGLPVHGGHPMLLARLPERRKAITSAIIEAEVIPYNEGQREGGRGPGIEEFWRLQAAGVSSETNPTLPLGQRHLCLAFFDILLLNGQSLIELSYSKRRRVLEKVVHPVEGFSLLASRVEIPLHLGAAHAEEALRKTFQRCCARREEGLVLKAGESVYVDTQLRWKDYIPNLGDCVDLVVLGAGWDMDRARELRVDTSVFTTFYIGTLTNREGVTRHRQVPHFEFLFPVSYGVTRDQLEVYNDNIRLRRWGSKPFDRDDKWKRRLIGLSWKYDMPAGMKPPSVLFEQPLCAEVMGAGFQRLPGSRLYELRWPRLQKIFVRNERSWVEALDAPSLLRVAHESLGYTAPAPPPPSSPEDDSIQALWRSKSTAVVDIPDTPTPKRTRRLGSRLSAPTVLKFSPPTPRHEGRSAPPVSPLAGKRRVPESPLQSRSPAPRLLFQSPEDRHTPLAPAPKRRRLLPPSPPPTSPTLAPPLELEAQRGLCSARKGLSTFAPSSPSPPPVRSSCRRSSTSASDAARNAQGLQTPAQSSPRPPTPKSPLLPGLHVFTPPPSSPAPLPVEWTRPLRPLRPLSIRSRMILHARRQSARAERERQRQQDALLD